MSILKRPYFTPGHRDKVSILDNIGLELLGGEIQLHVRLFWSSSDRQMEGGKTEDGYIYMKTHGGRKTSVPYPKISARHPNPQPLQSLANARI